MLQSSAGDDYWEIRVSAELFATLSPARLRRELVRCVWMRLLVGIGIVEADGGARGCGLTGFALSGMCIFLGVGLPRGLGRLVRITRIFYALEVCGCGDELQFSGDFTASNFCLNSLCALPSLARVHSVASDLLASFASKTSLSGTARGDLATQGCNFAKRNMWIE